jgi:hypothetical protein
MPKLYVVIEENNEMKLEEWTKKDNPLMMCGHTANATREIPKGIHIHCCAICLTHHASIIRTDPLDLTCRTAICSSCGKQTPSRTSLPFFEYKENKNNDSYYCGCRGWD